MARVEIHRLIQGRISHDVPNPAMSYEPGVIEIAAVLHANQVRDLRRELQPCAMPCLNACRDRPAKSDDLSIGHRLERTRRILHPEPWHPVQQLVESPEERQYCVRQLRRAGPVEREIALGA